MTQATRIVNHSVPRMNTPGKMTGTALYAADFALPNMLYSKVLRSREPHARLVRIDPSRATRLPGVRAVITATDVPDVRYGGSVKDERVFARERIRFAGQPLAAVAATSRDAATAALAAIEVVATPLAPVLDVAAALSPTAPLVHEAWASYAALPILHRAGNVCNRARIVVGDVERGFVEADRIFEHRFTTSSVHQGYTEPRAAVAQWDSSGLVTVWSNTQLPFEIQTTLAEILQLPPSKVRIIVPGIGGGFGGKLRIGMEHFAALLAMKTGRPVKVMTSSEEEPTGASRPAKRACGSTPAPSPDRGRGSRRWPPSCWPGPTGSPTSGSRASPSIRTRPTSVRSARPRGRKRTSRWNRRWTSSPTPWGSTRSSSG